MGHFSCCITLLVTLSCSGDSQVVLLMGIRVTQPTLAIGCWAGMRSPG